MAKKVRIGVIGTGGIANAAHLPGYSQIPDECEIFALCDRISVMNEGRVLQTLIERLKEIRADLGSDQVFDVVGEVFPSNLLISITTIDPQIKNFDCPGTSA